MKIKKEMKLGAFAAVILEKQDLLIIAKTRKLYVYSLSTLKKIRTLNGIFNPSSICTNEDNSMIYCVTTSNEFFSFEVATWNCIDHFFIDKNSIDFHMTENDWLEFTEIYSYDEDHLLAITLAYKKVMIINIPSRTAKTIWKSKESADQMWYEPSTDEIYVEYKGVFDNEIKETPIVVDVDERTITFIERYMAYSTVYMDRNGNKLLSSEEENYRNFIFKKTNYYVRFEDKEKNLVLKTLIRESLKWLRIVSAIYLEKSGLIFLLYDNDFIIVSITQSEVRIKESINLTDISEARGLIVYDDNKLFLYGWDYALLIEDL